MGPPLGITLPPAAALSGAGAAAASPRSRVHALPLEGEEQEEAPPDRKALHQRRATHDIAAALAAAAAGKAAPALKLPGVAEDGGGSKQGTPRTLEAKSPHTPRLWNLTAEAAPAAKARPEAAAAAGGAQVGGFVRGAGRSGTFMGSINCMAFKSP